MISGILSKTEDVWTLFSAEPFEEKLINLLAEKYKPLNWVQVQDIEKTIDSSRNIELVLFKTSEKNIWVYNILAKPDGWSWQDLIELVKTSSILVVKSEFMDEMKQIDLGMEEDELARQRLAEFLNKEDS